MTIALCMIPIVLQGVVMVIDEGWFHRTRGLPRWERIGHPLDTLTMVACLAWLLATSPESPAAVPVYVGLAVFSTLFVTKDEAIHARLCSPGEHWLHAVLFVLHPIVLAAFGYLWWIGAIGLLMGQLGIAIAFLAYQVIYWTLEGAEHEPVAERRAAELRVVAAPELGYTGFARKVAEPTVLGAVFRSSAGALPRRDLCDGSRDGQAVLVDEVRAGPVRDRGSRAR